MEALVRELEEKSAGAGSVEDLMSLIVTLLRERMPGYDWAGFYMLDEGGEEEPASLMLGPYIGAETPHKRIPLDQGICGAAAREDQTIVVDDVHADPRYLACSLETRSEIVAPIRVRGAVVGELDIDSHQPGRFGPADRNLVERCAAMVGRFLEKTSA